MATKKPSTATKLKLADAEVNRLNTEVTRLQKELESAKSYQAMYQKSDEARGKEIEEVHTLLDTFENCIPRKKDDGYSTHSCMVRLASWLANKK